MANSTLSLAATAHLSAPISAGLSAAGWVSIVGIAPIAASARVRGRAIGVLAATARLAVDDDLVLAAACMVTLYRAVAAHLSATSQIAQNAFPLMRARARVVQVTALGLAAAANVRPKPVKNSLLASSVVSSIVRVSLHVTGSLAQNAERFIPARAHIIGVVVTPLLAAAHMSAELSAMLAADSLLAATAKQSLAADALILGTRVLTMQAETRLRVQAFSTLSAGTLLTQSLTLQTRPFAVIEAMQAATADAQGVLSATIADALASAATVSITTSEVALAQSYVVIPASLALDAASRMQQTAQTAIDAGSFVGVGTIFQTLAARARIYQRLYTFGVLSAGSVVEGQGVRTLFAGASVAFASGESILSASGLIFAPQTPTLYASAYVVAVSRAALSAGARIGDVERSSITRRLHVEPYFIGDDTE